jgi:hypothetical protein
MSHQPIIRRSYLTEIKLSLAPSTNQRIFFLDVPELRAVSALVVGIECFNADYLTTSPNGNPVVSTVTGMILTVAESSTETVYQYPCQDLVPGVNSGLIRMFNNKPVNLPKSYITITNITGLNTGDSVIFNFIYISVNDSSFKMPSNQQQRARTR